MKREELTETIIRDWWLKKYHNTTSVEVAKKHPRLCKTPKWFNLYKVTQKQHDEWHEWMISALMKYFRCGKRYAKRSSWAIYLNCAPSIKEK